MNTRKEFELTEDEYQGLLDCSRSVPYMVFGGVSPSSPQERANAYWQKLGERHGFAWRPVRPGATDRKFTAEVQS